MTPLSHLKYCLSLLIVPGLQGPSREMPCGLVFWKPSWPGWATCLRHLLPVSLFCGTCWDKELSISQTLSWAIQSPRGCRQRGGLADNAHCQWFSETELAVTEELKIPSQAQKSNNGMLGLPSAHTVHITRSLSNLNCAGYIEVFNNTHNNNLFEKFESSHTRAPASHTSWPPLFSTSSWFCPVPFPEASVAGWLLSVPCRPSDSKRTLSNTMWLPRSRQFGAGELLGPRKGERQAHVSYHLPLSIRALQAVRCVYLCKCRALFL